MDKQSDKATKPVASKQIAPKPVDNIAAVRAKYAEFGWTAFAAPTESLNDIIAQKGKKLHFVQVITPETADSAKHTGLAKNTFIQNAFSNGAAPIYATIVVKPRTTQITFENINDNTQVIIGRKKMETTADHTQDIAIPIKPAVRPARHRSHRRTFTNGRKD
jgi:hypothetical protein